MCSLLNRVSGVVALDEPYEREALAHLATDELVPFVASELERQRRLITEQGRAESTIAVSTLGNHYDPSSDGRAGARRRVVALGSIEISESNVDELTLVVKHTIPFTCHLGSLAERWPMFGVVRNPLSILASWSSIDASYRSGRIPEYVHHHVPGVVESLETITDPVARQVELLSWHFAQFEPLASMGSVLRYEDIIASGGSNLELVAGRPVVPDPDLVSRNANPLYDAERALRLTDALMATTSPIWDHYTVAEVTAVFDEMRTPPPQS